MATQTTAATMPLNCYRHIYHNYPCPVTCVDQCPLKPRPEGEDAQFLAKRLREQADVYHSRARWCFSSGYTARGRSWRELARTYDEMANAKEAEAS